MSKDSFLGFRQVLLVGLGGVGGRVVDHIMENLPRERDAFTAAMVLDTDVNDMNSLQNIPVENRIVLASSPVNGSSMTVGQYLQKNPSAAEWFISPNTAAFHTLMQQSTKQGAKQIRMVSRVALAATAKYYNLENSITSILSKLNISDGTLNRDGLLVMIVCSIAGGTGAGTVLQFPMYLEEILSRYFDPTTVSVQASMLLPNLFNQTQASGNYEKGKVNGYAVMRELQSLNSGKLKRFEYLKDYVEVSRGDLRAKAPYSFVLMFDNATSSGAAINGSTDDTHVPNIADCIADYIFGPAAHKCTSQLDNTLDKVYSSGNTAIFRAVGKAELTYPDALYKQYAVAKWILRAVSEDWMLPDQKTQSYFLEKLRESRDNGTERPTDSLKHQFYVTTVRDRDTCRGQFFSEIRNQLVIVNSTGKEKKKDDVKPIEIAYWEIVKKRIEDKIKSRPGYINKLQKVKESFSEETDQRNDTVLVDFVSHVDSSILELANFAADLMSPSDSESARFLTKDTDEACIYTFIRLHKLHPIALRCFLYGLESILNSVKDGADVNIQQVISDIDGVKKKKRNEQVDSSMRDSVDGLIKKAVFKVATKMQQFVAEMITEVENFFKCLNNIQNHFIGIRNSCLNDIESLNTELRTVVGSREGMIACWNSIERSLFLGEAADIDVIDNDLSLEIDKMIYLAYYNWVSNSDNMLEEEENGDVFRPVTNYTDVMLEHLLRNFSKRLSEGYPAFFPKDIVNAIIYEAYVQRAYEKQARENPKFNIEKFTYSVEDSYKAYTTERDSDDNDATDLFRTLLVSVIKKAEPLCGPLKAMPANEDYMARLFYFNRSILRTEHKPDPNNPAKSVVKYITDEFIEGVSTSRVGNFIVQQEAVDGISPHTITCFSYTGGLELSDFHNMQDPTSGTFNAEDGRCYYNAYREYINKVLNTTLFNITPHLHKHWHISGHLENITDEHTDAVLENSARAFVYGLLLDNMIRIDNHGFVKFGIVGEPAFETLDEAVNSIYTYQPLSGTEHARYQGTREETNRILFETFRCLQDRPRLRSKLIEYGNTIIETAKNNRTGAIFKYCIDEEAWGLEHYRTIIDVLDGFYQYARTSDLHNGLTDVRSVLGYMFNTLCDVTIDVCAAIFASPKKLLEKYTVFVDKLYDLAICDDLAGRVPGTQSAGGIITAPQTVGDIAIGTQTVDKSAASALSVSGADDEDIFTTGVIETADNSELKPFNELDGDFSRGVMKKRMERYIDNMKKG